MKQAYYEMSTMFEETPFYLNRPKKIIHFSISQDTSLICILQRRKQIRHIYQFSHVCNSWYTEYKILTVCTSTK